MSATITESRRVELARDHAAARREELLRNRLNAATAAGDADEADQLRAALADATRKEACR